MGVGPVIEKYVNPESSILNVGAGNSRLSEEMFDEGYQKITNIDTSKVVVEQMSEKYRDRGQDFKYVQMDMRQMDFENGAFDVVIDKATIDSLLCGESSTKNAEMALKEIHRVLSNDGVFILISYGQPEHRNMFLKRAEYTWEVTCETVDKPKISTSVAQSPEDKDNPHKHFIYICQKK